MWHLLFNNLKGRKTYNAIIVLSVALALTVALVSSFMTRGVQKELEHKQRLLGPELAVVPPGTKETGHIYLTKGPPGHGLVPAEAAAIIKTFPEVEAVASQKILGSVALEGERGMLIGFAPSDDFMILPWLDAKSGKPHQGRETGIILGSQLEPAATPGDSLTLNGTAYTISGRLRETGSFMDASAFIPQAASPLSPSWIVISLKPGVSVDMMINKIETRVPHSEVIFRPEMLKTINDQLAGVIQGGGLGTVAVLVVCGALLVTGAMFALLVYERRREFGLLKAMGARNTYVFRLILGEAVVLGGIGGLVGLALSAVWLGMAGTDIAVSDASGLSSVWFIAGRVASAIGLTMAVAVTTAIFPALLVARMEPYAAIRSGE